jgi:hypothetical protein
VWAIFSNQNSDFLPPSLAGGRFERRQRENLGEGDGGISPFPRVASLLAPSRKGRGGYARRLKTKIMILGFADG